MKKMKKILSLVLTSIFLLTSIFVQSISVSAAPGTWTYIANLSSGRAYHAVAELNGKVYAVGGEVNGSLSNKVEEYDPITNSWTVKANMPVRRECHALTGVNGKLYAIGGDGDSSGNRLDMYDPATNSWAAKANMPSSRSKLSAAVANGKIYAIGGYNTTNSNAFEVYDPSTNTWAAKANMPTARQGCSAVELNGKIYVMGGANGSTLKTVEVYDPSTNTWSSAANMTTPRNNFAAVVLNGKIYAMGGFGLKSAEVYDPVSNSWTPIENMLSVRSLFGAAVVNQAIYAVGGSNYGTVLNTVEMYSQQASPLQTPTNVTATAATTSISVTWNPVPDASSYSIELDGTTVINNITGTSYIHNNLNPNTSHSYRVKAINSGGESSWSNSITKSTLPSVPAVPVSAGAGMSTNLITIHWFSVTGAESYSVEIDGATVVNGITANSYSHTGLMPNSTHTYRVKAVNISGESAWSPARTYSTLLSAPTGLTATSDSSSITVSWDAVPGALNYSIELDNSTVIDNITGTSYTHKGLQANTCHSYRIKAVGSMYPSDYSSSITKYTTPEIPSNLTVSSTATETSLSWSAVPGAVSYTVELDGTSTVSNLTDPSYIVTGLAPASSHSYRVKAVGPNSISAWSNTVSNTTLPLPPSVPTNISTLATATEITISWNQTEGAESYTVLVDGSIVINGITATSYTDGGLSPLSTHTYKVKSVNAGGESDWSEPATTKTLPLAPTAPSNISTTSLTDQITVSWDAVSGADSYSIELDGTCVVENIKGITYTHYLLAPGTSHSYKVKAVNEGGESPWSEPIIQSTRKVPPSTPSICGTSSTANEITFLWNSVPEAESYSIELDGNSVVNNITGTSYTYAGLIPVTSHSYRIKAINSGGESEWSQTYSFYTSLDIPKNINVVASKYAITLNWDTVPYAEYYMVEVTGDPHLHIAYENTLTINYLSPNSTYSFRVEAINSPVVGPWSDITTASTLPLRPNAPANIRQTAAATSVSLSWDAVLNAASYSILVNNSTIIDNITDTSYTFSGLSPNTSYTFNVKVIVSGGDQSSWSSQVYTQTLLPAPVISGCINEAIGYKISWDPIPGATSYTIDIDGSIINGIMSAEYYTDMTPHTFRVKAVSATNTSDWSNQINNSTQQ